MTTDNVTVLVAGDPGLADALRPPVGERIDVIGHVSTGDEAVSRVVAELPDVLLLDTRIEERAARVVCRRLREWAPVTRIVAATVTDDERAYTTMVAGAMGAVLIGEDDETVGRVVTEVARGEAILLPRMALRVLHDLDAWAARSADPLCPPPTLTATEREVLTMMSEGTDSATIAATHAVTSRLVNLHAGFAVVKLHRYVHGAEQIAVHQS